MHEKLKKYLKNVLGLDDNNLIEELATYIGRMRANSRQIKLWFNDNKEEKKLEQADLDYLLSFGIDDGAD